MSKLGYFLGGVATGVVGIAALAFLDEKYGILPGYRKSGGNSDDVEEKTLEEENVNCAAEASATSSPETATEEQSANYVTEASSSPASAESTEAAPA
jgi:hypothetical protein